MPGCAVKCVVVFVVLSVFDMFGDICGRSLFPVATRGGRLSHACMTGVPLLAAEIAAVEG